MDAGRAAGAARGDPRACARARPRRAWLEARCSPTLDRVAAPARALGSIGGMSDLSHVTEAGDVRMVDVGGKPLSRRRAVARATRADGAGDRAAAARAAEGRRAGDRAAGGNHGREADERADPALPSAAALAHRGDARGRRRTASRSSPSAETTAQTGVEMEALDGGLGGGADGLRHGEGDRQGHGHRRTYAGREDEGAR